jgi:hypothetical protein
MALGAWVAGVELFLRRVSSEGRHTGRVLVAGSYVAILLTGLASVGMAIWAWPALRDDDGSRGVASIWAAAGVYSVLLGTCGVMSVRGVLRARRELQG